MRGGGPKGRRGAGSKGILSYRYDNFTVRIAPLSQPDGCQLPLSRGALFVLNTQLRVIHTGLFPFWENTRPMRMAAMAATVIQFTGSWRMRAEPITDTTGMR